MIESKGKCLCCSNSCDIYRRAIESCSEYHCPECGLYKISDSIKRDSYKILSVMYFILLHRRPNNSKVVYFIQDAKPADSESLYIDNKMLERQYPHSLDEKINMVLLNLSKKIKTLGDTFALPGFESASKYYPLFMVDDQNSSAESLWCQVDATIEILQDLDLIKHTQALGDDENSYTLTARGWNRISELQEAKRLVPKAFIAMAFSPDMERPREKILQAITDSGYLPTVIDEKEHNNQIVPEIFFEIEQSTFIVADLTHHRNGVYYEAGYAQALNKEVIITCKDCDFEDRHFDIAQKNTIRWDDEEQLYMRLLRRIEATVGKRE